MGSLLDRVRRVIGRERAGPLLGLVAGALLSVALPAQAAQAAELNAGGGTSRTLTYTADSGEKNTLEVVRVNNQIVFSDSGTAITIDVVGDPNGICSGDGTDTVSCYDDSGVGGFPGGPGFNLLVIDVDDEDDKVENKTSIKSQIDGGAGEDTLIGGSNDDLINGGDDDDEIKGNQGNDELHGGDGDDQLDGGDGADLMFGDDGQDDLAGGAGADVMDTGLNTTGDGFELAEGDGDSDVVLFRYSATDEPEVLVGAPKTQEAEIHVNIDGGPAELHMFDVEQLHIFNEESAANQYDIRDLTGTSLKFLVLQSDDIANADQLDADATITVQGTTGADHIVLNKQDIIGNELPVFTVGWGQIIFGGVAAGSDNDHFITVNAEGGNDFFDVDLSLVLGNETTVLLNGGSGNNSIAFSRPQDGVFDLDLSIPTGDPESGTVAAGSDLGDIAFTDMSEVSLDAKGANTDVTINTPDGEDDIVYAPGSLPGSGTVDVKDIISFSFKGVGSGGSLAFTDESGGPVDNLEYNGSSRNETFDLGDAGDIEVTTNIAEVLVHAEGIAHLTLNAGAGNDTVNLLDGAVPFETVDLNGNEGDDTFHMEGDQTASIAVDGGAPGASDSLFLTNPSGDIVVDLENETVEGFGIDPISIAGIEHLFIDGDGNTPVLVLGTDGDDEIEFTPTGDDSGKLKFVEPDKDLVDLTLSNSSSDLEVDPGEGDDLVRTIGTDSVNEVEVEPGEFDADHTRTQVDDRKELFTLNESTELVAVDSKGGKDTITFLASCENPVHLLVDGNTPGGSTLEGDKLVIEADDEDAESKTTIGDPNTSGNVVVCQGEDESEVEFERIERIDAGNAGGGDSGGNNGERATQPDGVFTTTVHDTNEKRGKGKYAGADIYGAKNSGKGGQNVTGASRGPRISRTDGKVTIPFVIQNDGPNGSDSYVAVFGTETIQKRGGTAADPGVKATVGGEDISDDPDELGPIGEGQQVNAPIVITTDGAIPGRHRLVINIYSVNGGGEDGDNKFVDSVIVFFTVRK